MWCFFGLFDNDIFEYFILPTICWKVRKITCFLQALWHSQFFSTWKQAVESGNWRTPTQSIYNTSKVSKVWIFALIEEIHPLEFEPQIKRVWTEGLINKHFCQLIDITYLCRVTNTSFKVEFCGTRIKMCGAKIRLYGSIELYRVNILLYGAETNMSLNLRKNLEIIKNI